MRSPLFLLIASFIAALLIAQQFGVAPGRQRVNPTDQLLTMIRSEPRLALALAQADRGDSAALMAWLNTARREQRTQLAQVQLQIAEQAAGVVDTTPPAQSDAALYRYRGRLGAMANIPTGDPEQDLAIDNLLAYIHVAGTSQPAIEDVALARAVLPRLESAMVKSPSAAVWDTIGCVRFVAGDLPGARTAFDESIRLGEQESATGSDAQRSAVRDQLALYRTRRQAAIEEARLVAEQPGRPRAPLPLVAAAEFAVPVPATPAASSAPAPALEKP